jgi:hypothetical protein
MNTPGRFHSIGRRLARPLLQRHDERKSKSLRPTRRARKGCQPLAQQALVVVNAAISRSIARLTRGTQRPGRYCHRQTRAHRQQSPMTIIEVVQTPAAAPLPPAPARRRNPRLAPGIRRSTTSPARCLRRPRQARPTPRRPLEGKLVIDGRGQMPRRAGGSSSPGRPGSPVRAAIAVIWAAALRSNSSATA